MEEKKFDMFLSVLKRLETGTVANIAVEDSIVDIINSNEKSMTEEQKQKIYDEFVHYERLRRDHVKRKKHYKQFEEEKYREVLQNFFRDFSGW